jgi:hypothetical protein
MKGLTDKLRVYREPRTYTTLARLLLSLPLGLVAFTVVATGAVLVALALPVALVALAATGLQDRAGLDPDPSTYRRLREILARRRWVLRESGYQLFRLPLGVADFTAAALVLALAVGGIAAIPIVAAGGAVDIGPWQVDELWEAAVQLVPGAAFLLVAADALFVWEHVSRTLAVAVRGAAPGRSRVMPLRRVA